MGSILSIAIFISLLSSIWYSVRSKQVKEPVKKGILAGKLNISMGAMLIFISMIQLFLSGESTLRIIIGALFLVIGLFNLFAGIRNLSFFRRRAEQQSQ